MGDSLGSDAGPRGDDRSDSGPGGGGGGESGGESGSGGPDGTACGTVSLEAKPRTPNVILIIDQSGSMDDPFTPDDDTGPTRWDALRSSLLAADGLIADLQEQVRFGLALYSGKEDWETCPVIKKVDVGLGNLEAIRAVYSEEGPLFDTPTGDSVESVLDDVKASGLLDGEDPTIFVLATDGEPDTCAELNPQNGQAEAVAGVEAAFAAGVRTYLIAVADESELSQTHLRDMANAGAGVKAGEPDAESYRVSDDVGLRAALRSIVRAELSCTVPLKGKVTTSDPCEGVIELGGELLPCKAPDGWDLVDESSLELKGSACERLKDGEPLSATFPCGAAIMIL